MNHSKAQAVGNYSGGIAVVTVSNADMYSVLDTSIVDTLYTLSAVDSTVIEDSLLGDPIDHDAYWIVYLDLLNNLNGSHEKFRVRFPINYTNANSEYDMIAINWGNVWTCVATNCRDGCSHMWRGCSYCNPPENTEGTCTAHLADAIRQGLWTGLVIYIKWYFHL